MADHADEDNNGGDIFIYRGGRAPQHVTHVLIDKSLDEIEDRAFNGCENLLQVDTHGGIQRVRKSAFWECKSLRRINLKSAVEVGDRAFWTCENLESIECGDLEVIGHGAFQRCRSLKTPLRLPSIVTIGRAAFYNCAQLPDIELSKQLETIRTHAFYCCDRLERIAIPMKRDLLEIHDRHGGNQFDGCVQLKTVDLVGGTHKTVASLHMESWRTEMNAEINQINQVLPNTPADEKTEEIRQWMDSVIDKLEHYKSEHRRYVKEGITLLELALWKAKLDEKEEIYEKGVAKKVKTDADADIARMDKRMTCGADVVINNVLPFLQLE